MKSAMRDEGAMTVEARRHAETDVRLSGGGGSWPKPTRSVVLSVAAVDKTDGQSLGVWDTGCGSGEPNNRWVGEAIDPGIREIRVSTETADAQGERCCNFPATTTPTTSLLALPATGISSSWPCSPPNIARMTWSRHQQASSVSPQAKFDEGARLLARDHDQRVKNPTDPQDDVPVYVEFIVFKARDALFPGAFGVGDTYNNLTYNLETAALLAASFANVKVVTSIRWLNLDGSYSFPAGIAAVNAPAILLRSDALSRVSVHEWGHTVGLLDRNNDSEALMWPEELTGTHREVNVSESNGMNWSVWENSRWGW
ncbi:MAG: hypothetical protein FJ387_28395 [Verrucomicrobia bacterium]|nr:hypothetical protein [Verrucomicrobiota bacterium]